MEERMTELEVRFMEQQHLLTELSEVVAGHQREIDSLRLLVQMFEKKLAGEPGLVDARADEKPPHY